MGAGPYLCCQWELFLKEYSQAYQSWRNCECLNFVEFAVLKILRSFCPTGPWPRMKSGSWNLVLSVASRVSRPCKSHHYYLFTSAVLAVLFALKLIVLEQEFGQQQDPISTCWYIQRKWESFQTVSGGSYHKSYGSIILWGANKLRFCSQP